MKDKYKDPGRSTHSHATPAAPGQEVLQEASDITAIATRKKRPRGKKKADLAAPAGGANNNNNKNNNAPKNANPKAKSEPKTKPKAKADANGQTAEVPDIARQMQSFVDKAKSSILSAMSTMQSQDNGKSKGKGKGNGKQDRSQSRKPAKTEPCFHFRRANVLETMPLVGEHIGRYTVMMRKCIPRVESQSRTRTSKFSPCCTRTTGLLSMVGDWNLRPRR